MNQFTFTTDELCDAISTLVMCGSDKHPKGMEAALGYVLDKLGEAGKDDDIIQHLTCILTGLY